MAFQAFSGPPGSFLMPQFAPQHGQHQQFFHGLPQPQQSPVPVQGESSGEGSPVHPGAGGMAPQQQMQILQGPPGMMPHMGGLPAHAGFPGGAPPGMTPMLVGPGGQLVPLHSVPPHLRPPQFQQHIPHRPGFIPVQILPNGQQIPLVGMPPHHHHQFAALQQQQQLQGLDSPLGRKKQSPPSSAGMMAQLGPAPSTADGSTPTSAAPLITLPPPPSAQMVADLEKLRRLKTDIEAGVHPIYKPLSAAEQQAEREAQKKQQPANGLPTGAAAAAGEKKNGPEPVVPAKTEEERKLEAEIERKIAEATKAAAGPDPIEAAIGRATQRAEEAVNVPTAARKPATPPSQPPSNGLPPRPSFTSSYPPPQPGAGSHVSPPPYRGGDDRPPPRDDHRENARWDRYRPASPPPPLSRGPRRRSPSPWEDRAVKSRRYEPDHYDPRHPALDWRPHPDDRRGPPPPLPPRDWERERDRERDRDRDRAWEMRRRYEDYYPPIPPSPPPSHHQYQRRVDDYPSMSMAGRARDDYDRRRVPSDQADRFDRRPPPPPASAERDRYEYQAPRPSDPHLAGPLSRPDVHQSLPPRQEAAALPPRHEPVPPQQEGPYPTSTTTRRVDEDPVRRDQAPGAVAGAPEDEEWTEEERRQYEEEKRRYEEEKARYYRELEEYERKKAARAAEKRARMMGADHQPGSVVPMDGVVVGTEVGHGRKVSTGSATMVDEYHPQQQRPIYR